MSSVIVNPEDVRVAVPERELEQKKAQYQTAVEEIEIVDQATYEKAGQLCHDLAALRRKIIEHHAEPKKATHAAWRSVCAAENRLSEPVMEAESLIKSKIGRYDMQQRSIREKEAREAREAAELANAQELEAQIEHLEATGATVEEIKAVIDEPAVYARPIALSVPRQKVAGIITRELWRAEVTDVKALARAVADGKVPENYLIPNMVALNATAQAQRGEMAKFVPGVKGVPTPSVASRRS